MKGRGEKKKKRAHKVCFATRKGSLSCFNQPRGQLVCFFSTQEGTLARVLAHNSYSLKHFEIRLLLMLYFRIHPLFLFICFCLSQFSCSYLYEHHIFAHALNSCGDWWNRFLDFWLAVKTVPFFFFFFCFHSLLGQLLCLCIDRLVSTAVVIFFLPQWYHLDHLQCWIKPCISQNLYNLSRLELVNSTWK